MIFLMGREKAAFEQITYSFLIFKNNSYETKRTIHFRKLLKIIYQKNRANTILN